MMDTGDMDLERGAGEGDLSFAGCKARFSLESFSSADCPLEACGPIHEVHSQRLKLKATYKIL